MHKNNHNVLFLRQASKINVGNRKAAQNNDRNIDRRKYLYLRIRFFFANG
jgi:hypothetical protein